MTDWTGEERRTNGDFTVIPFKRFTMWFVVCIAVFLLVVWVAITLHDQHVHSCYPPKDEATERTCDWTFWFHDHPRQGEPDAR